MTLREIADAANWRREHSFINERDADIAYLLNAVAEERAKADRIVFERQDFRDICLCNLEFAA